MNKLRLIRIYEIRKQVHPIEQSIIGILDGNETYVNGKYTQYSKGGKSYFYHYLISKNIYLSYALYEEYETNFGCSKEETREIMKYLLDKHLNFKINEVR